MDLEKALLTRRSVRQFAPGAIDKKAILRILEAGRFAPSGLNNQPWRFLVLQAGDPRVNILAEQTKYGRIVKNAALLIAVFFYKPVGYNQIKDCQAIGACIQNMLLSVHDQELGAVWLGEIINTEPAVTKSLGLDSESLELMALLAIGRPLADNPPEPGKRLALEELLIEPF